MFSELYISIAYIAVVSVLILRDEYQSRKLNRERFEARAQVEWPVTVETISGAICGHTDSISATSALLVCLQPVYKGQLVKLVLNVLSRSLELTAEVVWTDRYLPSEKYYPHNAIAVRFIRISDQSRDFLTLAVQNCLNADKRSQAQMVGG